MAKTSYRWLLCIGFATQLQAADISGEEPPALNAQHTAAADLQSTIAAAISQFEQRSRRDWAYRISRYENEEGDISSSIEFGSYAIVNSLVELFTQIAMYSLAI